MLNDAYFKYRSAVAYHETACARLISLTIMFTWREGTYEHEIFQLSCCAAARRFLFRKINYLYFVSLTRNIRISFLVSDFLSIVRKANACLNERE